MGIREDLEAKAAKLGGSSEPAEQETTVRARPVRKTVDLPPDLNRKLNVWLGNAGARIERRVSSQEVMVALVGALFAEDHSITDALEDWVYGSITGEY